MAYLIEKEIDKTKPEGDYYNPIMNYQRLEQEEKSGHRLVAEYLGFKLKWDVRVDDKVYIAYPVFKLSYEKYDLWDSNWNHLQRIVLKMNEDNLFDDKLKEAWLSLDTDKVWGAIINKLKKIKK